MLQVRRRDAAPAENARPNGGEIVRGDRAQVETAQPRDGVDSRDEEIHAPGGPEWNADLERRAPHVRRKLRALEQAAAQLHRARAVQLDAPHIEVDKKHRIDVVAESDVAHVIETAHEEAGANEEHDGERALYNE